jgi:hypothetical protein
VRNSPHACVSVMFTGEPPGKQQANIFSLCIRVLAEWYGMCFAAGAEVRPRNGSVRCAGAHNMSAIRRHGVYGRSD